MGNVKSEKSMASASKSLRLMVEHWLTPGPATKVHVAEFRNSRAKRQCYVRIEITHPAGTVGMFFFRHRDGNWRIYPPQREWPIMRHTWLSEPLLVPCTWDD